MKKQLRFSGWLFFLILILGNMPACTHEESPPFNRNYDVLQELQTLLLEETERIDFQKDGNFEPYLLQGWSFPSKSHIWAVGKRSRLRFYRYNLKDDVTLELFCKTFPSQDSQEQITELQLNGRSVASFVVNAKRRNRISLTLPADLLQAGLNILEFRYSYTVNSREVNPDAKNERELAVSFEQLLFTSSNAETLQFIEKSKLLQKTGTQCDLLLKLPTRVELDFEYQSLTGVTSFVRLIDDSNEVVREVKLPSRKQTYTKRIILP
ncbi:MAG: hypothetical protein GY801_11885, partial [bacterium]|nr:hypothetical protein [bacterium]